MVTSTGLDAVVIALLVQVTLALYAVGTVMLVVWVPPVAVGIFVHGPPTPGADCH